MFYISPSSHPSQVLFLSTLLLGSLVTLSASTWMTAWVGLELNLLSFLPMISAKNSLYNVEASLKYFLSQALASALILGSSIWTLVNPHFALSTLLALFLKLGAAPFHFWLPSVAEGILWPHCIILLTVQKLAPMCLIPWILPSSTYAVMLSSLLSGVVGSLGGFNQNCTRKILAFSSINHMGWLLAAMTFSVKAWLTYFISYCIVSISIMVVLHDQQTFFLSQMSALSSNAPTVKLFIMMSMLSLGGLPPFLGFIPKWMMTYTMIQHGAYLWLTALITTALITLFFYLRLLTDTMMLMGPKHKFHFSHLSKIYAPLFFVNFFPIFLVFPLLSS